MEDVESHVAPVRGYTFGEQVGLTSSGNALHFADLAIGALVVAAAAGGLHAHYRSTTGSLGGLGVSSR